MKCAVQKGLVGNFYAVTTLSLSNSKNDFRQGDSGSTNRGKWLCWINRGGDLGHWQFLTRQSSQEREEVVGWGYRALGHVEHLAFCFPIKIFLSPFYVSVFVSLTFYFFFSVLQCCFSGGWEGY